MLCGVQELIDMNQGLLSSLGVSHPSLERVVEVTAKHGLHTKLTGAGGGGFAFSLITPNTDREKVSKTFIPPCSNRVNCLQFYYIFSSIITTSSLSAPYPPYDWV